MVLGLMLGSADARAQFERVPSLESCARIEAEQERLECYDSVLRARQQSGTAPEPEGGDEAQTPDDAAPGPSERQAAPQRAAAPAPANAAGERAVVIVEVELRTPLPAVFKTHDGETWVQTGGGYVHYLDDAPFPARIRPGTLGSFFLVPDDGRRGVRIRQLQ